MRGRIAFSRITVLDNAGTVTPRHLNKHIDYDACCAPIPNPENAKSVAFPMGMAITQNGQTLYVAALGSSKVAVYNTTALENDTFTPDTANQILLSGGGPTGVLLDESKARLYVLTRFDNAIKIINTQTKTEIGGMAMYNPEPAHVVVAAVSCTTPRSAPATATPPARAAISSATWITSAGIWQPGPAQRRRSQRLCQRSLYRVFASMKGVMTTQSLRGMDNQGPMHWRGDRTGAALEPSAQPNSGHFNERLAFKAFNVAFPDSSGATARSPMPIWRRSRLHPGGDVPPDPIRNLDNSFTPQQQLGFDIFFGPKTFFDPKAGTGLFACGDCHTLNPGQRRFDHQAGVLWLQHPVRGGRNPYQRQDPAPAESVPKGRQVRLP